jgi:hypothetical protein
LRFAALREPGTRLLHGKGRTIPFQALPDPHVFTRKQAGIVFQNPVCLLDPAPDELGVFLFQNGFGNSQLCGNSGKGITRGDGILGLWFFLGGGWLDRCSVTVRRQEDPVAWKQAGMILEDTALDNDAAAQKLGIQFLQGSQGNPLLAGDSGQGIPWNGLVGRLPIPGQPSTGSQNDHRKKKQNKNAPAE